MCIISSCTVLIGQIGFLSGFDFSGSCIYMISRGWWFYATLNGNDYDIYINYLSQVAKCSIKVELVNDSYSELRGEIAGPPDTPYQGGNFHLEIKIPETYPFNPPKVSSLFLLA